MDSDPTKAELKAEIEELKTKVDTLDREPSGVSRRSVVGGLLGVGGLAAAIPYLSQPAAAQQALGAVQVGALRDDNGDDQLIVENGGPVRIPNALEADSINITPVETGTTTLSAGSVINVTGLFDYTTGSYILTITPKNDDTQNGELIKKYNSAGDGRAGWIVEETKGVTDVTFDWSVIQLEVD